MKKKYRIIRYTGFLAAVAMVVSLVAFLVCSICGSAFANTVATVVDNSGYYVSISSNDIAMNLVATPEGATTTATDTIVTKTNSPTGYKLYISMDNNRTNGNRLYKDGNSSSGYYISPVSGTVSNPVDLTANTWGYTTEANADKNSKFIGVPLRGGENLLQSTSTPDEAGIPLDITYGVNASMALDAGIYSGKISYTAVAEGQAAAEGTFSVFPTTTTNLSGGEILTIATDLYTNMPDIGEIDVVLSHAGVNYSCLNPTKMNSGYGAVSIRCILPEIEYIGAYNVSLSLPKFGKEYFKSNAVVFNNELTDREGNPITITTMQEMTHAICSSIATPIDVTIPAPAIVLRDTRDDEYYTVKKLADGHCWMTDNLRLKSGTRLTANDSDLDGVVISNYTMPEETTAQAPIYVATLNDDYVDMPVVSTRSEKSKEEAAAAGLVLKDQEWLTMGVYYSWPTITVESAPYSGNEWASNDVFGNDMTISGNNTVVSICPKGWRLPTGWNDTGGDDSKETVPGSGQNLVSGEFVRLYAKYNNGISFNEMTRDDDNWAALFEKITNKDGPSLALSAWYNPSYIGATTTGYASDYYTSTIRGKNNIAASSITWTGQKLLPTQSGGKNSSMRPVRCIAR